MSSRKKNLPSPGERKGEAFWRELNSADWDGKSCSQVFEEFVDVMFCTLSAGKVEDKGRAMFQKDRDRKIGVFQRAMLLLGEEMEREPYRDLLGRVYQDVAGTAGKRALSAVYTPDAICKMTAGMGMDIELVKARIRRGETVSLYEPACGAARMVLAVAELLGELRMGLRVTCEEIDLVACKIAYVNLSMWGVPAVVYHADSLSRKCWEGWKTAALVLMEAREEEVRRLRRMVEMMMSLK